ncbi:MAG: YraN family protein [Oscillospiraceae bacterium]|nr:YraN family protein [Oscillospiraceae bacterium]
MNIRKITGNIGEEKVVWKYRLGGYKIIARNFSCRYGELDIVAEKNNTIVIVEVKTRKNADFACAKEFVDYKKQNRIKNTTNIFLQKNNLTEHNIRFDVAEVYTESNTINIIENAF